MAADSSTRNGLLTVRQLHRCSAITGGMVGNRGSFVIAGLSYQFFWNTFTVILLVFVGAYQWTDQAAEVVVG